MRTNHNNDTKTKKSKFNLFNFLFFCKNCKETDSMVNSTIEKNEKKIESIALKNSNYTQNNLALDFRKISSEGFHYSCNDKKSLAQKHSLFQKQSIFGGVDEITSFPENALFFLKNTPHLMIARLIVLNLKNVFNNKKLKIVSKSFNQKVSEQEKSHHAKIFDSISFFTDKIIESFCKKFKKFNTVLCLDIKTSIQFSLNGVSNICITKNLKNCSLINFFSEYFTFKTNMDLINGDFETINLQALRKVDLIFINYEELFKSDDAKDFPRRFHEIIKKSFSITRNIVIIFPKTLKLTNLVTLFGGSMELLEKEVLAKSFSIEIELVKLNSDLEKILVYMGLCNSINPCDEETYICNFLNSDNFLDYTQKNSFILSLIKKIGVYKCCQTLCYNSHSEEKTILQMFLDSLVIRKMMSSEELLEMIQKDEKPKEVTPILKRQVSWKSIKNIGKKKIFEEEDDNKAPSSQKISIYTDNIFENLSDIYDNKLSVLKSPKSNYSFRRSFSEKRFFV